MTSRQGRLSSGWSLIRVLFYEGGFSSGWSLIQVVLAHRMHCISLPHRPTCRQWCRPVHQAALAAACPPCAAAPPPASAAQGPAAPWPLQCRSERVSAHFSACPSYRPSGLMFGHWQGCSTWLFPDASLVRASAPESRSATQVAPLGISDS